VNSVSIPNIFHDVSKLFEMAGYANAGALINKPTQILKVSRPNRPNTAKQIKHGIRINFKKAIAPTEIF
jgi:hypothetical protein